MLGSLNGYQTHTEGGRYREVGREEGRKGEIPHANKPIAVDYPPAGPSS